MTRVTRKKVNQVKLARAVTTVFGIALLSAMSASTAKADEWNRKTVVRFGAPVEIPGVHLKGWGVLPAGTYVFKIFDSPSDRHIVQIFSEDGNTIYATILAIPNYRLRATDKTVITFRERAAGQPEALRAWFYPGRNWGEEFVYPKPKALELAKVSNLPVLAMPADVKVEVENAEELQAVAELKQAPVTAVKPTGEEVELAQVVEAPPALAPAAAAVQETTPVVQKPSALAETPSTLPATASPVPLIGLFGLLALGGAAAVRFAQKHVL
jgi:hypothetical protein